MSAGRIATLALAASLGAGCLLRHLTGAPTGTCEGACDHYVDCRGDAAPATRDACLTECPQVLSDRDSLMAFERLSCPDALDFIEGPRRRPLVPAPPQERATVSVDPPVRPGS